MVTVREQHKNNKNILLYSCCHFDPISIQCLIKNKGTSSLLSALLSQSKLSMMLEPVPSFLPSFHFDPISIQCLIKNKGSSSLLSALLSQSKLSMLLEFIFIPSFLPTGWIEWTRLI
jgi:hypothetical protein